MKLFKTAKSEIVALSPYTHGKKPKRTLYYKYIILRVY